MDFPIGPAGVLNVSVMERFDSGTPYSDILTISVAGDTIPGNSELAYAAKPTTSTYFLSDRGEHRWDDVSSTDVALNYRLPIGPIQFFAEGEVINALNEQAQIAGNTSFTRIAANPFNPFTTTPILGTHYTRSAAYGDARSAADYQTPRTYRLSFGVRF